MTKLKNIFGSSCPSLMVCQRTYHNTKDPPLFFITMRLNIKVALLVLSVAVFIITLLLWTRCSDTHEWNRRFDGSIMERDNELQGSEEIDCDINGEYTIGCRKEGDEVYLPFSFLHKYFEVYGKLAIYDGTERFEWSHSYSRVYRPKGKYDPRGVFMYFENYNVEVRDRVKCVSGSDGVPVSTQWESQGYYYPTQIAQFGLSHYSKNLTEPEPRQKVIEDGDKEIAKWTVPPASNINRVFDNRAGSRVLRFYSSDTFTSPIKLKMDHVLDFVISLNVILNSNSSFSVILQNRETKDTYNLYYVASDILITAQDNNIYHGIGVSQDWKKLTRDLIVDLQKGLSYLEKDKSKRKLPRSKLKVIGILLYGRGAIDNLTLSSSEHIQQFYDAAEWFVKHQDSDTGGWPIPVKRKLASGFQDLQPGWYSSMGQGHAISVLARAYHHSGGDVKYLKAAINGLKPFRVPSSKGGVMTSFLNKFPWYEEYPTKPASFVLNGFIYSLLGLYDLMTIAPPNQALEAESLFKEGLLQHNQNVDMGFRNSFRKKDSVVQTKNESNKDESFYFNPFINIGTLNELDVLERNVKRQNVNTAKPDTKKNILTPSNSLIDLLPEKEIFFDESYTHNLRRSKSILDMTFSKENSIIYNNPFLGKSKTLHDYCNRSKYYQSYNILTNRDSNVIFPQKNCRSGEDVGYVRIIQHILNELDKQGVQLSFLQNIVMKQMLKKHQSKSTFNSSLSDFKTQDEGLFDRKSREVLRKRKSKNGTEGEPLRRNISTQTHLKLNGFIFNLLMCLLGLKKKIVRTCKTSRPRAQYSDATMRENRRPRR